MFLGAASSHCPGCGCGAECTPLYENATPANPSISDASGIPSSSSAEVHVRVTVTLSDGETFKIYLGRDDTNNQFYVEVKVGTGAYIKIFSVASSVETELASGGCDEPTIAAGEVLICATLLGSVIAVQVSGATSVHRFSAAIGTPAGTQWGIEGDGTPTDLSVVSSAAASCPKCVKIDEDECVELGFALSSRNVVADFSALTATEGDVYFFGGDFGRNCTDDWEYSPAEEVTNECHNFREGDCESIIGNWIFDTYADPLYNCTTGWFCRNNIANGLCCSFFEGGGPTDLGIALIWTIDLQAVLAVGPRAVTSGIVNTISLEIYITFRFDHAPVGDSFYVPRIIRYEKVAEECEILDLANRTITLTKVLDGYVGSLGVDFVPPCIWDFPDTVDIDLTSSATTGSCGLEPLDPDEYACLQIQRCDCPGDPFLVLAPTVYYTDDLPEDVATLEYEVGDIVEFFSLPGCYEILSIQEGSVCIEAMQIGEPGEEFLIGYVTAVHDTCELCAPSCDCCSSDGDPTRLVAAGLNIPAIDPGDDYLDEWSDYVAGAHSLTELSALIGDECGAWEIVYSVVEDSGRTITIRANINPSTETCDWEVTVVATGGTRDAYSITFAIFGDPKSQVCDGETIGFPDGIPHTSGGIPPFGALPAYLAWIPQSLCGTSEV